MSKEFHRLQIKRSEDFVVEDWEVNEWAKDFLHISLKSVFSHISVQSRDYPHDGLILLGEEDRNRTPNLENQI